MKKILELILFVTLVGLIGYLIYNKETTVAEQSPPTVEKHIDKFVFSDVPKSEINAKQLAYEMQYCRMVSEKMPEIMVSFSKQLISDNEPGKLAQLNRVRTTVTSFTKVIERNAMIHSQYDSLFASFYQDAATDITTEQMSYDEYFKSYIVCYEKYI